jgi:hypothetical protein
MLLRKASVGTWEGGCVTRECRPCFHHGTWRRASSRVLACVCIGIVLKMRRCELNLPAGGCSRPLISPLRMPHYAPASGVWHQTESRPPMPPLSRPLSRPGSTGLTWPLWAQAWLRGWLRSLDSIPTGNSAALGSLSRVQESPEPRWGRRGGGEGAANLG